MKTASLLLVVNLSVGLAAAQLSDPYRQVHFLTWVVADLNQVDSDWTKLGFGEARRLPNAILERKDGAQSVEVGSDLSIGRLGAYRYLRIQPGPGERRILADFLARHQDGILALNHRFVTVSDLQEEVERLEQLGVSVLDRGRPRTEKGEITYVYMDTAREGKYVLGLVHDTGVFDGLEPSAPINAIASQYALVVRDLAPVSAFWSKLGFPALEVTHSPLTDLTYSGRPGNFDQKLGWQRHGEIVYEWIEPLRGPTTYEDALARHGEGFHHVAFNVDDIDAAVAYFDSHGIACSQSGGWGEKGRPGSGRFAYVDTDALGGLTIELLWNYRSGE